MALSRGTLKHEWVKGSEDAYKHSNRTVGGTRDLKNVWRVGVSDNKDLFVPFELMKDLP